MLPPVFCQKKYSTNGRWSKGKAPCGQGAFPFVWSGLFGLALGAAGVALVEQGRDALVEQEGQQRDDGALEQVEGRQRAQASRRW